MWAVYLIAAILALPVVVDLLAFLVRAPLRSGPPGDAERGLVIFVESIRWLGVRWGFSSCGRGLRQAGFGGELLYWRWHAAWRAWLVLPAIMDAGMLEAEAGRLAEFIARQRREHPDRPIWLIGYSCGGYVAVRALERLGGDVRIESAAVLAGAFSPQRDLSAAARRVRGRIVLCSSLLDWFIIGLGTLVFGTADRKHTLSAGMVGLRGHSGVAEAGRLVEVKWRPALMGLGQFGGHFTAPAAGFIGRRVAPPMGIGHTPPR